MSMPHDFIVRMFKTIDARQWDQLPEFFHPEMVYDRPGYPLLEGRDAVVHFYREVRVLTSGEHQLTAVVMDGDYGACWGRFVGAKKDGTPVDLQFADCYVFRDHQLVHRKSHFYVPLA